MTALWQQIREEIRSQFAAIRPFIGYAGETDDGKVKLRRITELTAGAELYAKLRGLNVAEDDVCAWLMVGGKPLLLGAIDLTDGPVSVLEPPIRTHASLIGFNTNGQIQEAACRASYMGRASAKYTSIDVAHIVATGGSGFTWAELAIATSDSVEIAVPSTVTTRGFTDVTTAWGSNGVKLVTVDVSDINPGDHMWAIFGNSATTRPFLAISWPDWAGSGVSLHFGARPSTWGATETGTIVNGLVVIQFAWQGYV